jgi:TolA-binding protein
MIRKFLFCASLACLLFIGMTKAQAAYPQSQSGQQTEQTKSVTGKVTSVETGGKAFDVEVNQGSNKQTMRFVVDQTTQVQGHVGTGTTATVQYQPKGSDLVALTVIEKNAQPQPEK